METSRDSTLSLIFDVGLPLVINSNLIQISDAEGRAPVRLILAARPGMIAPFVAALGARVGKDALFLMASFRDCHQLKGASRSRPRVGLHLEITGYHGRSVWKSAHHVHRQTHFVALGAANALAVNGETVRP
jgi:hypothetical protein